MTPASAHPLRYIPERRNLVMTGAAILGQVVAIAATGVAWNSGWIAFAPLLVCFLYFSMLGWLLIHEAIHAKLSRARTLNDRLGRVLSVLFGCPFHILKIGHMSHHRYNRGSIDTTELIPHDTRHGFLWGAAYYARILGLLYVSEVIAPLLFFAWSRAKKAILALAKSDIVKGVLDLFTRPIVNAVRIDALLCALVFAAAIWIARDALAPLAILFAGRAVMVSYYDNAYHYGTDPNDVAAAFNLSVPRPVAALILNHNLHRVHHRYPLASWSMLPRLQAQDADGFDASLASKGFDQLKGPMRRPAP
jgi:fatty acid desaturase